jgi:glutamate/tyrosine decarboxylase-like PLP-dependent enzyme
MLFPKHASTHDQVMSELQAALQQDADWRGGRLWSLVYFAGDDVAQLLKDAYSAAIYTNGLGPGAFRSLRKFESEVVGITAELLGLPGAPGNMTSGGTESILMAVKTARDWAVAEKGIAEPEMVLPVTAHPAFDKAAQYLGIKAIHTPIGADYRAGVEAMREAVTERTVLLVGSAPCYPFGVIDPIEEIGALGQERGVPCHVDACLGGFFLPFMERLGHALRPWDFRAPGVSSISSDLHKYGYSARGASTVVYRDREYRKHQFFAYEDWPGGLYGSPTMTGSRPGGAIAAAWAVLRYLGEEGYLRLTRSVIETARALIDGVNATPGLQVLGEPDMSVFAFAAVSGGPDIQAVGDVLDAMGWNPDRQQLPSSLHLMVTPAHAPIVDPFLAGLRRAVEQVQAGEVRPSRAAAVYGMLEKMPDRGPARQIVVEFLDRLTQVEKEAGA